MTCGILERERHSSAQCHPKHSIRRKKKPRVFFELECFFGRVKTPVLPLVEERRGRVKVGVLYFSKSLLPTYLKVFQSALLFEVGVFSGVFPV